MFLALALVLSAALFLSAVVIAALCARATAKAWSNAAERVAASLDAGGKSLAEALGGFWEATNTGDSTQFVALDEFVSQKFLADVEGDMSARELVLESEL